MRVRQAAGQPVSVGDSNILYVYFAQDSSGVTEGMYIHCKGFFRSGLGTVGDTISVTGREWRSRLLAKIRKGELLGPQPCAYNNRVLGEAMIGNDPQPRGVANELYKKIVAKYKDFYFVLVTDNDEFAQILLYDAD